MSTTGEDSISRANLQYVNKIIHAQRKKALELRVNEYRRSLKYSMTFMRCVA